MSIPQKIAYKEQELASNALMSKNPQIVGDALRHIQAATQNGVIPAYVGIPLVGPLAQHFKQLQAAQAMPAPQMPGAAGPQPTIAQQTMAEAQGIEQAQSNLPETYADGGILNFQPVNQYDAEHEYAGGGMVAFSGESGSLVDDDDTEDEDDYEDRLRAADMADAESQTEQALAMNDYLNASRQAVAAAPVPESSGISSINLTPAASKGYSLNAAAPSGTGIREDAKAPRGLESLEARIIRQESGGRDFDKNGNPLTSKAGAKYAMQVMPATAKKPGFGIEPAKNDSPEEYNRVGRELIKAFDKKYKGDEQLILMAYNWGPGAVDNWLKSGADVSKVPAETRKYASLAKGGIAQLPTKHFFTGDPVEELIPEERITRSKDPIRVNSKGVARLPTNGATIPSNRALVPVNQGIKQIATKHPWLEAFESGRPIQLLTESAKAIGRGMANPFTAVGAGGAWASGYGGNRLYNMTPEMRQMLVEGNQGDTSVAAGALNAADQSKPIATWIPDWLLPDDLVERRDIEQGKKKPEPAKKAEKEKEAEEINTDYLNEPVQPFSPDGYNALQQVPTKDPFEGNPMLKEAYDWFKTKKEGLTSQREQDKWMSILAAGLGMMGGTSPHGMANIGQGALQGIQSQLASNKLRAREESHLGDLAYKLGNAHEVAMARKAGRESDLEVKQQRAKEEVNKNRDAYIAKMFDQKGIDASMLKALRIKNATGELDKKGKATLAMLEDSVKKIEADALSKHPMPVFGGKGQSNVIKLG